MGSRTLPTECHHGVTVDWGDFGSCQGYCDIEGHDPWDCPDKPGCRECEAEEEAVRTMRWTLYEEEVRGFFIEHHLPFDTADEWTETIVSYAKDHLQAKWREPEHDNTGDAGAHDATRDESGKDPGELRA